MRDWLRAAVRRTIIYNRQPRKLAVLPFALAATVLAVYVLWTGSGNLALFTVMLGLIVAGTLIDVVWWLVLTVRNPGASIPF